MKKKNLVTVVLIVLCLAVYLGYRAVDKMMTDSTAPRIAVASHISELPVNSSWEELLNGVTANDDVDGDVTDTLVVEKIRMKDAAEGIVTVHVAAFDKSGNVAKSQYEVRYSDYHSPRFSLSRPLVFSEKSVGDILSFVSAEDMIDGDLTRNVRATALSGSSISAVGIHDVEIRVTNSLGDMVKLVIPVEVLESGSYDADLKLTQYLVYLQTGDPFNAKFYLQNFTVNRNTTSLTSGLPEGFTLQTTGEVDTSTPGTYAVSYQVSYYVPGTSTRVCTGYSKLIVVVEG